MNHGVLRASLVAQRLKYLPTVRETWVQSLGREDPLEKEMATHSSILAWRIPWTEEPGGLQSTVSQSWTRFHFHFHGVLKARILKWFAFPFSIGPRFVRTLHHDPSVLGGATRHDSSFH